MVSESDADMSSPRSLHHARSVGGAVSAVAAMLAYRCAGAASTQFAMAAGLMTYSALLIHQTQGLIEMHFHIFAALAFLIAYCDWRVPVVAAAVVAVHHVAFYFMQHAGVGAYVVNHNHGFLIVLVH